MSIWPGIGERISAATGRSFAVDKRHPAGGGCISSAVIIEGGGQRYFVKLNGASNAEMFAAEVAGLEEIASARAIRVPTPICWGMENGYAYLVLEYVEQCSANPQSMGQLGQELARLHRFSSEQHGWHRDNTIGSTPQVNTPSHDWVDFWRRQRLGLQLELAARNGHGGKLQRQGERLAANIGALFCGYTPIPSLLHGDLWYGNYAIDIQGHPFVFDPAVYYGDHEADLAMTELFGGFDSRFYEAYQDAFPLESDYPVRKTLYNLYHILNHLNIFGGDYRSQAERMIDALLSEIR